MRFENVLNLTTALLAIYLLYKEFSNFLIVKPTQSSVEQSSQKTEYFPAVIACPVPAFNLTALKEEDYEQPFKLLVGHTSWSLDRTSLTMMTANLWGGKTNMSQIKLLEKVLLAFNSADWITGGWVLYEKEYDGGIGNYQWMGLNLLPQRVIFPLGKCLKLDIPKQIRESKIVKIGIEMDKKIMDSHGLTNIDVYFRDPNANLQFSAPSFKIQGGVFNSGQKKHYALKTKVGIKLAEDPRTACKEYEMSGQYENCKEEELRDLFHSLIGCVPIWFTDQPEHCGQQICTERNLDMVYDLMSSLNRNF